MTDTRLQDLNEVEAAIWRELAQAAGEPRHEWRRCVVATAGPDGPEARTMVLRECDAQARLLVLYTDARSPKLQQVAQDPRAQIVCWSSALNWQLRLRCHLQVETQGLAVSTRWARVRFSPGAQDYLSHLPPGAALQPHAQHPALPRAAHHDAVAHHHFAVLIAQVQAVDWLELHAAGHRRARFEGNERAWRTP